MNQLNSFQGKAADEIKRYFSRVHGTTIAGFQIAAEELKNEFQKAIESFNSTVDSDSDTKIYGNYLDNVKKKLMDTAMNLIALMKKQNKLYRL